MGLHNDSMKLLQEIYDVCYNQHNHAYNISIKYFSGLTREARMQLESQLLYLKDESLITEYAPCSGTPFSVRPTSLGIQTVEQIAETVAPSSITIHGNVSGIVGNTVTGNTINQGYSFDEMQELIRNAIADPAEQQAIEAAIKDIYSRIEKEEPLEKGMLNKVATNIERYQGIIAAVGQTLTSYLLKM